MHVMLRRCRHQGRYTQLDTRRIPGLLQQYNSDLTPTAGGGLKDRVDNLMRMARLRGASEASQQPMLTIGGKNQEDVVEVYHFLQGHIEGARAMQDTVRKLRRDMAIMMASEGQDDTEIE